MEKTIKIGLGQQLVHLKEESVDITSRSMSGNILSKEISLDDFTTILTTSVRRDSLNQLEMDKVEMGANIVGFRHSEKGFVYYFLVRRGKYPFNNSGKQQLINYPNLLFMIAVDRNYILKQTRMFVVKEDDVVRKNVFGIDSFALKNDCQLYKYPIGNVGINGDICWGGNTFPKLDSYVSIQEYVYSFFVSPSNADFACEDFRGEKRKDSLRKLQNEDFPEEILVQATRYNKM